MSNNKISQFAPGEEIGSSFVVRKKEMKIRYGTDETYLSLELGDASGRISASLLRPDEEPAFVPDVGDVVRIKGKVESVRERLYLKIIEMRFVEPEDVDITALLPEVENRSGLWKEFETMVSSVSDSNLRRLLHDVFSDSDIAEGFKTAPAGKFWHHNYIGGLLEHTLGVAAIANAAAKIYPGVKRDLLTTAALLHDIGKISSYSYRSFIDFTDEGRLLGHIVIGSQLVRAKINELKQFPKPLATELLHLILSHQGKLEQASPVVPMTLEGLLLYYADELDSKANAFLRIKKTEKKPGKKWSSYVPLTQQYYFFGDDE